MVLVEGLAVGQIETVEQLQKEADLAELGDRLRAVREARSMTQAALSDATGLSRGAIVHIERGAKEVRILTLRRIAEALGVSVGQLVD